MWEAAGIGVYNPKLNSMIQEYGYAIAQLQNERVTDKDFSSGVQQGMGFDPNGKWLDRGKFATSTGEVIKMLDETIAKHHVKVEAGLQQYNDASVNGKDTKILYKPANLKGLDAPPEETAADVRGDGRITAATSGPEAKRAVAPVKSAADYDKRLKDGADPEFATLPDHDKDVITSFRAASAGRGPDAVTAKANAALTAIKAKAEALAAEIEAADAAAADPWGKSPGVRDDAKLQRAGQELARLKETEAILRPIAEDASKRAAKTIDRLKDFAKVSRTWQGFDTSREAVIEHARKNLGIRDKAAITKALDEVEAEVKKSNWRQR
jgi:hypothetical protein